MNPESFICFVFAVVVNWKPVVVRRSDDRDNDWDYLAWRCDRDQLNVIDRIMNDVLLLWCHCLLEYIYKYIYMQAIAEF